MEKYNLTQTGAEVQEILNTAIPQSELTEEVGRAQGAEQTLQDKIDAEELRAKAAESDLEQADTVLQGNIDAEELRAKAAESDLEQADTVLQGNIDAEELRAKAAEKQNADEIDVIEEKIPTEASSSNQLADKAFVNSSIASNTATYRGSFNQVNDLHLTLEATEADIATALESVIDNADNNDYCYIQVPVSESAPTEIAQVDRYKFNGTTWAYEYTLNNSGFTADQWAALNSAITSGLVAKLSALPNMAELTALLAGKQNLLNFDNVPTTGSNNPVTSGGVKTAIDDEKTRAQAAEQANNLLITQINGKIPSDATSENKLVDKAYVDAADATMQSAIEGILALIPEAATALNQLADKAFVNSSIATNTGTFKGTYNVVLDLELFYDATHAQIALMLASKITSAKNNDYCYVQVPNSNEDPTSINHTDRYKYNGTAWAYEYTLNNSGFTTAQWAAINSGITELLKNKLVDLPTATELAALLNAKQNTLTFDTAPTPNSTNPVTSDGIHAAINVEKERAEAAEEELDTNKADKATTLAGYGITDAYTKNEVNNMITTPNQQYVTVATYASLPASGSKDTIYRVSNYNGANSQVDNTVYSEYAWNGTQYVFLCVKSQIEEVFDITVYNSNTKYADLAAALGVDGANIPATLRRGGMSVKFVQSSDNNFTQYLYHGTSTAAADFTNTANWEKINLESEVDKISNTIGIKYGEVSIGKILRADGTLADYSNYYVTPYIPFGGGNLYVLASEINADAYFVAFDSNYQKVNSWRANNSTEIVRSNLSSDYAYIRCSFKMDKTGYLALNSVIRWDNRTFDAQLVPATQIDLNVVKSNIAKLITDGYIYGGTITPSSSPRSATPYYPTFYLCTVDGDYTNFNLTNCKGGTFIRSIFIQGSFSYWTNETTNICTKTAALEYAKVEVEVNNLYTLMNYLEHATPSMEPDVTTKPKIYIADKNGTYTNFIGKDSNPLTLADGESALLSKVFNQGAFHYWRKTTLNLVTLEKLVDYVTAALEQYSPDPEEIEGAVTDWLDAHPEATTTVQDGSITQAKLSSDLALKMANLIITDYQATYNRISVMVGYNNGNANISGVGKNVVVGMEDMNQATTAERNVIMGYHSGFRITDATETTSIGNEACDNLRSGSGNTAVGGSALRMQSATEVGEPRSGNYNTCIGYNTMFKSHGDANTCIGANALNGGSYDAEFSGCLAVGFYAGNHNPNGDNNKFYLDNRYRDAQWKEVQHGMMYGEFNDSPALQKLRINVGEFSLPYLPTSDPQVAGALWNDNGVLKISSGV